MTNTDHCPRCAREIPAETKQCEYCGQAADRPPDLAAFFDDLGSPDPAEAVEAEQDPLAHVQTPADSLAVQQPSAGLVTGDEVTPTAVGEALAVDAVHGDLHGSHLAAQHAVKRGMSRGELATLSAGVLGGAVLFLALLSARGSAAPDSAADTGASTRQAAKASLQVQPPAPATAAAPAEPAASWVANPAWVGSARRGAAFELAATNDVQVWLRKVRPVLIVRCMSRTTEAFVFTDSAAKMEPEDGDHTVRVRFDGEAESTERWPDSAEHDALFAPDGAAFARRLAQARTVDFSFTPHNAEPAVAHFNVAGLARLLEPVARQCGGTAPQRR